MYKLKKRIQEISLLFNLAAEKGILLIIAAVFGAICANTGLASWYENLTKLPVGLSFGELSFGMSFHHFINDFLMAIFFLAIGLEIKYEVVAGHLSTWHQRSLPFVGAVGGMIVPIIIYTFFNHGNEIAMRGWAIPGATDIAFALAMLALFGKGLPLSLRIFLTALAIIDDLFAVVIIALFYSDNISNYYIGLCFMWIALMFCLNRVSIESVQLYLLLGVVLWYLFYMSGVHATIGGVIMGLIVPLGLPDAFSPLKYLQKSLEKTISFIILPLFAFINCGVVLGDNFTVSSKVVLGTALGLLFGKQIGVFFSSLLTIRFGFSSLPQGSTLLQFYGVSILCGIGFTMSLFIAILAFGEHSGVLQCAKIGVILGSFLSAILAAIILHVSRK